MASGGAHEPTVDEAIGYHDRLDICVHIVTPRAHVTGSSELGPPTSEPRVPQVAQYSDQSSRFLSA